MGELNPRPLPIWDQFFDRSCQGSALPTELIARDFLIPRIPI
jgi:hypothetical protein